MLVEPTVFNVPSYVDIKSKVSKCISPIFHTTFCNLKARFRVLFQSNSSKKEEGFLYFLRKKKKSDLFWAM